MNVPVQSQPTSNRELFIQCTTTKNSNDESKQLYILLNSVIIQYLEILGFHKTISTFVQESTDEGFPVQPRLTKIVENLGTELSQKDVDQLIKYFDDEDTKQLSEKWEYIRSKCPVENRHTELRLNIDLRIYIDITIPYRRNYSDDEKQLKIHHLMEAFKAKDHDEVSDAEILSLYALPFVTNPVEHPVFSKFFSTSWIENLRNNLKIFCQSWCRRLPDPFETDVAKMYRLWFSTNNVISEFGFNRSNSNPSDTLRLINPTSLSTVCKLPEDSLFRIFFANIRKLKEDNEKMKQSDQAMKTEYMQKIQLCDALVTILKDLYTKQGTDQRVPWDTIIAKCSSQVSIPESLSEYSFLGAESMMANGITDDSEFSSETNCTPDRRACQHYNISPRIQTSSSPRGDYEGIINRIPQLSVNNDTNPDASEEPTLRVIRHMLSARGQTRYQDQVDNGDFIRQSHFPFPSNNFDNKKLSSSRSLLNMMQTNAMLRDIVTESANINEE